MKNSTLFNPTENQPVDISAKHLLVGSMDSDSSDRVPYSQASTQDMDIQLRLLRDFYSAHIQGISPDELGTDVAEWPVVHEFDGLASGECVNYCNSQGIIDDLRILLSKAKIAFSCLETVFADLSHFQDEGGDELGHVVLRITVRSDQENTLREYDDWIEWEINSIRTENSLYFTTMIHQL
jgi:hypothetical protein